MPIYEIICSNCHYQGEAVSVKVTASPQCPNCGSTLTNKLMAPTSTLTGRSAQKIPQAMDTACCGRHPGEANCAGPGSCCGKTG